MPAFGYLIRAGVRRAVATREAGRADIPAVIVRSGLPDLTTRLRLDELFSPKAVVLRDSRYIRDTEYPTLVLGTEPPPILVHPLNNPTSASRFTPLLRVQLV